ncbi:MAG: AsmA family protein [Pseudomonadota bacterium]
MMKKLLWIAGTGVVALIIVLFVASLFLGPILKAGIETVGPKMTQTELNVGMVTLRPFSGKAQIHHLFVGNPAGFSTPFAVSLKDFSMQMNTKSVLSKVVWIDHVLVDGPEISYETNQRGNNIETIQRNVEQFTKSLPGATAGKQTSGGKKVIIHELVVKNAKLLWTPRLTGKTTTVDLPEIRLTDIGKSSGGAEPSQVVSEVLGKVLAGSTTAISGAVKNLGEGVKGTAGNVGKGLGKLFKK